MSAVCLAVGGLLVAVLPVSEFDIAWTHSVEKVEWRETWQAKEGRLVAVEAAVRGSGAGMEPPAGAVLKDGAWRYRPDLPSRERLVLAHSPFGGDYRICWSGECRPLAELAPEGPVEITVCGP